MTHIGTEVVHISGISDETNKNKPFTIKSKQDCIDWCSTIEFNPKTDYSLIKWNLSKEDFNLDN